MLSTGKNLMIANHRRIQKRRLSNIERIPKFLFQIGGSKVALGDPRKHVLWCAVMAK